MKLTITLLLLCIALSSCSSTGGMSGTTPPKVNPTKTFYLKGEPQYNNPKEFNKFLGINSDSRTIDLKGNRISGKNLEHPKDSQDEKSIGLRLDIANLILKNGIIEDIPGGVFIRGRKNTLSKLTFLNAGEDFLSTQTNKSSKRAIDLTVDQCKFYNDKDGDKSLQFNNADGVRLSNCYVTGGITGMRLGESSDKNSIKATITGNTFESVETGMNISGVTTVTSIGNIFKNVKTQIIQGNKVKVIN